MMEVNTDLMIVYGGELVGRDRPTPLQTLPLIAIQPD